MKINIKRKISLMTLGVTLLVTCLLSLSMIVLLDRFGLNKSIHLDDVNVFNSGVTVIVLIVVLMILSWGISLVFSSLITKNISKINQSLELLEKGALPEKLDANASDEIGQIAARVNTISENLRETSIFANEIGKGNYNDGFKPLSHDDILRNSLIGMTKALQDADSREKERAWVLNSIAEVGDILRNSGTLEVLSENVIKFVISQVHAVQGAFYIASVNESGKQILELKSIYAYNRKKYFQNSFLFGEGLAGQAAIEMTSILRTEVPDDYCTITSGILGDIKPSCIFLCPLISDEKVFGVIEIAGLKKFTNSEVQLIEEAGPIIARTIFNIQVSESTQKHLDESKRMSNELQMQQEELRQNAEEMQATQEELQKSNEKLEVQIEEVRRAQSRMQSLLENASEVITIFNESGKIKYVSPSVKNILGYNSQDLIGEDGVEKIHEEDKNSFEEAFDSLLSNSALNINLQFRYILENGESIWLEASGRNMLQDPSILGIVFNCRDITLKRKAEIEERMRRNMQALSENSPDLITRISCEGKIIYTNPTIEIYTGAKPSDFINQVLEEIHIGNGFASSWKQMLENVKTKNEKVSMELSFHSPIGNRIMQVNGIPEYNDGNMESVLVVSHDITEQKIIENEVKEKNKNINESINYSKRIQNAIIPDNKLIQNIFPESFILYKPRDVVSGDFPWFMLNEESAYIAAVDCTGHGVPGAMLSLVGYFHLSNIVENLGDLDPGKILDMLDEKVNNTLIKSGNDENIKDGMDIAFCKVNLKKKYLEYSGAHRPLYYMSKEGFQELKGNRWAIGGGTYKNQSAFTNYKLNVKKGESVFFFSDGFPDQFGGTENRKFGTARIKSILENNQNMPMNDLCNLLNHEIEDWKGKGKQTDDIIMIGIKF